MRKEQAFLSGLVGAGSLTLVHEAARQVIPHAPRVDVLGMRAIAQAMRGVDQRPASGKQLYWLALIGDILSNALYYIAILNDLSIESRYGRLIARHESSRGAQGGGVDEQRRTGCFFAGDP